MTSPSLRALSFARRQALRLPEERHADPTTEALIQLRVDGVRDGRQDDLADGIEGEGEDGDLLKANALVPWR